LRSGPIAEIYNFYKGMGLECPVRKDPGSFLQEITTPVGQLAYASDALLASKGIDPGRRDPASLIADPPQELLIPVADMVDAFWVKSAAGQAMLSELEVAPTDTPAGRSALASSKYANGAWVMTKLVLLRQYLLSQRSRSYYLARMVQTLIMSLVIASLYATVSVDLNEGRNVISMSMLSVTYLSMINTSQVGLVFSIKP
jgi:hypothetical protein